MHHYDVALITNVRNKRIGSTYLRIVPATSNEITPICAAVQRGFGQVCTGRQATKVIVSSSQHEVMNVLHGILLKMGEV